MRVLSRTALALVIVVLSASAGLASVGAQQPQLSFDPPFGACRDAKLTIRGEGFPAGTIVALFGGAAEGPALDNFALTTEQPEVDASGAFEITLDRVPFLCTVEKVGVLAFVETTSGEVVSRVRAVYFVAIEPPASGSGGAAAGDRAGLRADVALLLATLAALLVVIARHTTSERLR